MRHPSEPSSPTNGEEDQFNGDERPDHYNPPDNVSDDSEYIVPDEPAAGIASSNAVWENID